MPRAASLGSHPVSGNQDPRTIYQGLGVTLLLASLLFWAPLPFGSVTPLALLVLEFGCCLCLVLAVLVERPRRLRRLAVPLGCLAAFALLGLLQSIPLPSSLVAAISPEHARLYEQALELAGEADTGTARLSLAPLASRRTALWLLALGCGMAATVLVAGRRLHRRLLLGAVVLTALFEALYGARRWTARATTIWRTEVPGSPERLRGTFVNSNHLAFYLTIGLVIAFAWGWWSWRQARREEGWDRRLLLVAPPALVWLTLFVALTFTGSRSGLLAALGGTLAQVALVAWRRRQWWVLAVGAGLVAAALGVAAAVGFDEAFGRLLGTSALGVTWSNRLTVYGLSLGLWLRFPWTGTGMGSFLDAFQLVRPAEFVETWRHAHNDWLELLMTTGVVGTALFVGGLVALGRRLVRVLGDGRRLEDRSMALAALGALAAAAVHSALDFSLTMPANALTLAVLVAVAAAARTTHRT